MSEIRGVNLGNWLVLEYWMDNEVFRGVEHKDLDETNFCLCLGNQKIQRLKEHRDTYITLEDFKAIKEMGLNTVRIPIPHWIFGDCDPYVGCIEYLDKGMEWARETGLKVLIDLHTAPGCQNGFDNGGIIGQIAWHTKKEYVDRSIAVLEKIAERYQGHEALYGIQLLNEPVPDVPTDILKNFYKRAYHACRAYLDESVAIVIHDQFQFKIWKDFMQSGEYKNVVLDTHIYHCFSEEEEKFTPKQLLEAAAGCIEGIKKMKEFFPIIVGEWSLGFHPEQTLQGLNEVQRDAFTRAYASVQTMAYEHADGWFFWSYKLNNKDMPAWDYRTCVEKHWMPEGLQ